jgi:HAMP domain-containing protein
MVLLSWDLTRGAHWVSKFQRGFLGFSAVAFVIVAVPPWLLTFYLSRGCSQLLVATQHVQRGELHYQIATRRKDELGEDVGNDRAASRRTRAGSGREQSEK